MAEFVSRQLWFSERLVPNWSHGGPTRDIHMTDTPTHQEVVLFKKEMASSSVAVTPWVDPPRGFLGTIAWEVYDGNIHK